MLLVGPVVISFYERCQPTHVLVNEASLLSEEYLCVSHSSFAIAVEYSLSFVLYTSHLRTTNVAVTFIHPSIFHFSMPLIQSQSKTRTIGIQTARSA